MPYLVFTLVVTLVKPLVIFGYHIEIVVFNWINRWNFYSLLWNGGQSFPSSKNMTNTLWGSLCKSVQFDPLCGNCTTKTELIQGERACIKFPMGLVNVPHSILVSLWKNGWFTRAMAANKRANSHNFKTYRWINL